MFCLPLHGFSLSLPDAADYKEGANLLDQCEQILEKFKTRPLA